MSELGDYEKMTDEEKRAYLRQPAETVCQYCMPLRQQLAAATERLECGHLKAEQVKDHHHCCEMMETNGRLPCDCNSPMICLACAREREKVDVAVVPLLELLWKFGFQAVFCGFDGVTYYECKECKWYEGTHEHANQTKESVKHEEGCKLEAALRGKE